MTRFEDLEGVWVRSHDPCLPRPWLGIVGGLHGNELCGVEVVRALANPRHPWHQRLGTGTLVLIHGNPRATEMQLRHTPQGVDLNRLFSFEFTAELPADIWNYEQRRAVALRPLLEQLDGVLDLHSSTARSDPFAISSRNLLPLASRLGCPWLSYGWDAAQIFKGRILLAVLQKRGRPAMAVECGQHDSQQARDTAWAVTEQFLRLMGVLREDDWVEPMPSTLVEVVQRVRKPSENFRFSREFHGFDRLLPGDTVGEGDGMAMVARDEYRVLLPNHDVAVGEDMLYLGKVREALPRHRRPQSSHAAQLLDL